jgi:hypothetical protein
MGLASPNNSPSVSDLNPSRPMEIHHPAAQLDTQFVGIDEKLDDKWALALVRYRSTALRLRHITPPDMRAKRRHVPLRSRCGNFAIFAAIRRASCVNTLAAARTFAQPCGNHRAAASALSSGRVLKAMAAPGAPPWTALTTASNTARP